MTALIYFDVYKYIVQVDYNLLSKYIFSNFS